jgi:hypothetical protein
MGDVTYDTYGADLVLEPGATLRFDIEGSLPTSTTTTSSSGDSTVISTSTLIAIILVAIGIIIALAGGTFFWLNGRAGATSPDSGQPLIDGLIGQIAELDEAFQAGEITEDIYHKRRAKLKTRLAELMDADG